MHKFYELYSRMTYCSFVSKIMFLTAFRYSVSIRKLLLIFQSPLLCCKSFNLRLVIGKWSDLYEVSISADINDDNNDSVTKK